MTWQPAGVVYPDIELVLTAYLRGALEGRPEAVSGGVYVSNAVPKPRRDRMVIVRRDGGLEGELRDRPRVSLRVWAKTEQEANDLASLVEALVKVSPNGDPILSAAKQSGPIPIPDESKSPLRYLVFDLATRGEQLQGV